MLFCYIFEKTPYNKIKYKKIEYSIIDRSLKCLLVSTIDRIWNVVIFCKYFHSSFAIYDNFSFSYDNYINITKLKNIYDPCNENKAHEIGKIFS